MILFGFFFFLIYGMLQNFLWEYIYLNKKTTISTVFTMWQANFKF